MADVFYLAAYPYLMAGPLLLIRSRSPGADRASLLDALVVTVGLGMVSWVFLVGPVAHSPDLTLAERVVSMATRSWTCCCWPPWCGWSSTAAPAHRRSGCCAAASVRRSSPTRCTASSS